MSLFGTLTTQPLTLIPEITQCIERLVIGMSGLLILESNSLELCVYHHPGIAVFPLFNECLCRDLDTC